MLFGNSSPNDEPYFEMVAREITSGELRAGLWARCMTDAQFDEKRAKASYVKQRVKEIKQQEANDTAAKEKLLALTSARATASEAERTIMELSQHEAKLAPVLARRGSVFFVGIFGGLLVGSIVSVWTSHAGPLVAGIAIGFVGAWLTLLFMPSQRQADEDATRIRNQRQIAEARHSKARDVMRKLS